MKTLLLATLACLLDLSCAAFFYVEANSTCNGATVIIEGVPSTPLDCSGIGHPASALQDGNLSTWWQSATGDSDVALSFSNLTVPPPVRVLAITLYWMSEAPELVTVEQWNGQSFEPALVCNVMAGCLEPHSSNVCIPCNLEGMEQMFNFTPPGIVAPWNIVLSGFQPASSNFYAIEEVSLSVACDEGAYLTQAGCVYNRSCNGCETRLREAASAVNSDAGNVTDVIELIGNLTSAASGFGALDDAAAEDAAVLAATKDELEALYTEVSLINADVQASSYIVIDLNSKLNYLLSKLEDFCIPNSTAIVNLVVSLKGEVEPVIYGNEGMDNIVEWAAGNVSIWETATRGTIDKINSTAVLLAGWNYNDTSAESDNEAYARQLWSDSNATLAAVMEQGKEGKYLKVIVDDARSKLDMASDELNRLIALVSTLEGNEAYLATWMDNVRENVVALNDSIATLKVNLTAVNRLINSSAVVLSSARERLNASDQLLMGAIPKALESLDASLSAAEAQSERCTQLLADAANYTRELQQQGAQIRSLLSASINASTPSDQTYLEYASANRTLWQAVNETLQASGLLSAALAGLQLPSLNRTLERAKWVINAANYTNYGAMSISNACQGLLANFSIVQTTVNVSLEEVSAMEDRLNATSRQLQRLQDVAVSTMLLAASVMDTANRTIIEIASINSNISIVAGTLSNNATASLASLNATQKLNSETNILLDEANDILINASNTLERTQSALYNISRAAATNEQKLNTLNSSVSSLQKQLQQALNAAAMIDLALHMYGSSSLQYNLPAPPTSSSLHISLDVRPDNTTGSLLFLGDAGQDYVGLHLDEGNVVFQSNTFEMITANSTVQVGQWYQIYASQDEAGTWLSVAPLQGGEVSTDSDNMTLGLNPITYNASVLVGGGQFLGDGYSGCIDHVIINSVRLPLLVPDPLPSTISTCAPRPAEEVRSFDNSSWFQGAGSYAMFQLPAPSSNTTLSIELQFRSAQPDGLLYAQERVVLYLSGGRVVLKLCQLPSACYELTTVGTYNSGWWCGIEVVMEIGGNVSLAVNGSETIVGVAPDLEVSTSVVYVGGVPAPTYGIVQSYPSFAGCMSDLMLDTISLSFVGAAQSNRMYPSSCPSELGSGVRFMGLPGGALFNVTIASSVNSIDFYFRTTQIVAPLLHISQLSISLYHTRIRLDYPTGVMVTNMGGLNDNQWHRVSVYLTDGHVAVVTDGGQSLYLELSTLGSGGSLSVGGVANGYIGPASSGFRGCIANLSINQGVIDFSTATLLDGVALYGCNGPSSVLPSSSVVPSLSSTAQLPSVSSTPIEVSIPYSSDPFPTSSEVSIPYSSAPFSTPSEVSIPYSSAPFSTPSEVSIPYSSAPFSTSSEVSIPYSSAPFSTPSEVILTQFPSSIALSPTEEYSSAITSYVIPSPSEVSQQPPMSSMNMLFSASELLTQLLPSPATSSEVFTSSEMLLSPSTTPEMFSSTATPSQVMTTPSQVFSSMATTLTSNQATPLAPISSGTLGIPVSPSTPTSNVLLSPVPTSSTLTAPSSTPLSAVPTPLSLSTTYSVPAFPPTPSVSIMPSVSFPSSSAPSPTCAPSSALSCTPTSTSVGTNGNLGSFLAFNISAASVLNSFNITLSFRTATSNAVLLYSLGRIYPDYLALELRQGKLVFSYQLGSGPAKLQSSKLYNDNANHTVVLWRHHQNGSMTVDSQEVITGVSPVTYTQLNLDGTLLFVGGIPLNIPVIGLMQPGTVPPSALACFSALTLNGGYYDLLSNRVASTGIEQCRTSYISAAMFNGTGYATMLSGYSGGVNFNLSITLKTTQCSGLLAYVASATVSDFVALEMYNGNMRFLFDNGGGPVVVTYSPSNASELCNDQWHTVVATKSGVSGTIRVDSIHFNTMSAASSSYVSVNTMDPLYIGGVPKSTVLRPYLQSKQSFNGCINNFQVTNGMGTLAEVPFSQAVQTVGVKLYSCGI